MIMTNPRLLNASLEKRLNPRLAEARQAGIATDAGTLSRMAQYTDEKWEKSLVYQINPPGPK
jgi:hypothetical protein